MRVLGARSTLSVRHGVSNVCNVHAGFRNTLWLWQILNYCCCEIPLEKLIFSISCRQAGHFINIQKPDVVSGDPSILYNKQGSSLLNQIKHRGASLSMRSDTEKQKMLY